MKKDQEPELTGAFELFSKSSALVQKNIPTFAVIYLLPFLTDLAFLRRNSANTGEKGLSSFGSFSGFQGFSVGAFIGFGIIIALLVFAVWLVVSAMTYGLLLQTSIGKKPSLDNLWPFARKYWFKLFVLSLLVSLLVLGGLILFIIPGLIMIRRYFLAPYVLLDNKDISIWEAMKKSAALSKPYSMSIWSIIGVIILLSLPSIVPLFGWFITFVLTFLYSVAPALRYQELKKLA